MQENNKNVWSAVILGVSLVAGLSVLGFFISSNRTTNTITVTGSSKTHVTADLAKWSANFTLRADLSNLKDILEKASSNGEKIKQFIVARGIDASSITLLPIQTDPVYDQGKNGYGGQDVIGYNVRQEVRVESGDITKIDDLAINAKGLVDLGIVAEYQHTDYLYTKLAELRPKLFADATKDAETRAKAIAEGTGVKVGALRTAKTGVIQLLATNSMDVADYGAYDLSTKEKEASATVTVSFELVP
ncbi:MAG: SIMPL domain-containing protein [Candidatus Jorgensenbacteria bacterium]|nr:SIMPL domain-containing protein [Candidatus Jorgensenbacteria bacterium]